MLSIFPITVAVDGGMKGKGEEVDQERGGECLRVGVAQASSPALYGDDDITLVDQTKTHGLVHSPSQTLVNVVLPYNLGEIRLSFGVNKGIDTTIQVRVSGGVVVASNLFYG